MTQPPRVIVLSLPGYTDPGLPIGASRAGALGVLDLEYETNLRSARAHLATLANLGGARQGVKLDLSRSEFLASVVDHLPAQVHTIVVSRPARAQLRRQMKTLLGDRRQVLIEVTNEETAK